MIHAYARVSTVEQTRGVSIEAQVARIQMHAPCAVLQDPGVSASIPLSERPAGGMLLSGLQRGDTVIAAKLDRLFRDAIDALQTCRAWQEAGIGLIILDMGGQLVDTRSATGWFVLTMLAACAEMERNLIRERTRSALQHLSGRLKAGEEYTAKKSGRKLERLGRPGLQGPAAERITTLRQQGHSLREIARILTAEGLLPARGGEWHASAVRSYLMTRGDRFAAP